MSAYAHQEIEKKWQDFWKKNKTFAATENPSKKKYYALDMFPYPSGAGLHVGHPLGYTATDIISRKKRHEGYEVLHPMGWDAFGLPAENYAIKTGVHPSISTNENIQNFQRQIESLGFSYDWDRSFSTTDEDYYKWSQWIFLQLYKKGLAYEKEMGMNWCPSCKVVCANEEVEQGKHERCATTVEKKNLKQWVFRITDYAQRLLQDLDTLEKWPEKIIAMQKNWIGKSKGAHVDFEINRETITVFTTRPDTLFGATYFVLSPEHPLVQSITTSDQKSAVEQYQKEVTAKSDLERTELSKEKTGVFTGSYAINPVNNEKIPVWIADYVLMSYGTGAVMAVPAHDERDHEFATTFNLPIIEVIDGLKDPFSKEGGKIKNSDFLNGMSVKEGIKTMIQWLEENKKGKKKVNYKLRDWIFTRQRYWGEPIPLVFDADGKCYPIADSNLPLTLPDTPNYEPSDDGKSPLAKIEDWVNVRGNILDDGTVDICNDGKTEFTRETSTMPNWAGSSWYWLRFMDPQNNQEFCSKEKSDYWGPVDLYVGGAEHAVLHLLYARFWHKVLYDLGVVSSIEPFTKLVNQGLILAEDGQKMSKSLGNVVNPDEIVEAFGADTLRMYEMFMGPFEQSKSWSTGAVGGTKKFLDKIHRFFTQTTWSNETSKENLSLLHKTIKTVGEHIDTFKFNTAVSSFMILFNQLQKDSQITAKDAQKILIILSPFAPHLAEEIWNTVFNNPDTITYEAWPTYDEQYLVEDTVSYAVQVNGKLRDSFEISKDTPKDEVIAHAKTLEKTKKYLEEGGGGEIKKEIFVPGKIVGFVVK